MKESLVVFPLLRGYRFWVPKRHVHKRKRGERLLCHEALFPGDILVDGEDFEEPYTALLSFVHTDFYTLLEKWGEGGKIITEEENDLVRRITGNVSQGILEGGRVRFAAGDMVGLEANVQKLDKRKSNVMLRPELLGKTVEVWTAIDMVEGV